jgi:hypothetical protein
LYFDCNRGVFVRSGKVVRRGFLARHSKHLAESKNNTSSSHFYFMYPSRHEKRNDKQDKLGCFEHPIQVIAAGFDPTSQPVMHVNKDFEEGGLLIMSKDDQCWIASCLKKDLTSVEKYQEVIGYNLALSLENNVSRSPGFNSILGVFG